MFRSTLVPLLFVLCGSPAADSGAQPEGADESLIAVSPGKFGIAVISLPLEAGNSVRARKAIIDISNALGGNPLASKPR